MACLLATGSSGPQSGLYLLDTASGATKRLYDRALRGITAGPDGYYAVSERGAVIRISEDLREVAPVVELPYDGCHDLRWIGGRFYLVASRTNEVVRLDRDFRALGRILLVDDTEDVCHANCLLERDGDILLTIFTLSPGRRSEKRGTPTWRHDGKILRLDWECGTFDTVYEPLSQPHSLTWRDGRFYCCQSFTSEITSVVPETGAKQVHRRLLGFVRGLAFADGMAYAGISQHLRPMSLLERLRIQFEMKSGVVELDPSGWKPRRRFPLPGTQVYELLPVGE